MDAPYGMILLTGPTGSGKTTTLYTVLRELNDPTYNVLTCEDPVEYTLPGINHMPINHEIGVDFAVQLRSILRGDPDIIMIGEIRDSETADICVKAAMTGHQVLSTLHTNDAASAISRLTDMGVDPLLVADSLLLVCAQRLIRRLCPNCKTAYRPGADLLEKLGLADTDTDFYHGIGCERCNRRGYLGRVPIIEALPATPEIKQRIGRATSAELKQLAMKEGMQTLRMVALEKAKAGITSLDEVYAVTASD
jgi:type IV pilus assembly protein PilB